jgi:hypothetical protein
MATRHAPVCFRHSDATFVFLAHSVEQNSQDLPTACFRLAMTSDDEFIHLIGILRGGDLASAGAS